MSHQGDRRTGTSAQEDAWWAQLYDETVADTGPAPSARDSLDDRFASASGTLDSVPRQPSAPPRDPDPERPRRLEARREPAPETASGDPEPGDTSGTARVEDGGGEATALPETPDRTAPEPPDASAAPAPGGRPSAGAPWSAATTSPPPAAAEARPDPRTAPAAPRTPPAGTWSASGGESGDTPSTASTRPPTAPAPFTDGCPDAEPVPAPRADGAAPPDPPVPPAPATDLPPAPERLPRRWHRRKERATAPAPLQPPPDERRSSQESATGPRPPAGPAEPPYVGDGPPTYDAEPAALPAADPDHLDQLVPDTVLDGGRHGSLTLRAVSLRGDSTRFRGEPRRDALLTARFGTGPDAVLLLAVATGARTGAGTHRAAAEACGWIARAVGRSHARLAGDLRDGRRAELSSGLHRLTDHALGRLRARAAELGVEPEAYTASLRCLLLPADPARTTRVFFGVGDGGLHRLRDGAWQDLEPYPRQAKEDGAPRPEADGGERITMDLGIAAPPGPWEPAVEPVREPFRFRASVARPGDVLLLSTAGFAAPLREEPEFAARLRARWGVATPPGLDGFLADARLRVKGYADDRTAAAVWEA
ncbi:protein phosphatase 2C domain-containing protein [Streptomyces albidoflavus]|uniref:protein phosphatase 2C domain-containing protein n=1 Tax=Streptomyces albidoflavus TaxID=1886 RepID=UPI00189EA063|nr:protein phosphatase 2C domain-containing protein [Streptomyces albidoflavus]